VLFCLDHDIAASVGDMLRRHGHDVTTAGEAGLARGSDDDITVWAHNLGGVLITTDREFSQRKARNVIGRHVWMRCPDPDVAEVLARHLDLVIPVTERHQDVLMRVSRDQFLTYFRGG
jgi:predicted nuclease of predicted toxin-antitoxin system